MKNRLFPVLCLLLLGLYGCNDKHIWHLDNDQMPHNSIGYDWSETLTPADDKDITLVILSADGSETVQTTTPEGAPLYLENGTYQLIVKEETEHISYDKYEVSVDSDGDGTIKEPAPFSAGTKDIVIADGELTDSDAVLMVQQTRELAIIVRISAESKLFDEIDSFQAQLTNVTVSRDIAYGFAPIEPIARQAVNPVYETLILSLEKETESSDKTKTSFQVRRRLLGLGSGNKISFTYHSTDLENAGVEFFVFDATEALADFHTLKEVLDPFVLLIDLAEDALDGKFYISDWEIGDESHLIAEEK